MEQYPYAPIGGIVLLCAVMGEGNLFRGFQILQLAAYSACKGEGCSGIDWSRFQFREEFVNCLAGQSQIQCIRTQISVFTSFDPTTRADMNAFEELLSDLDRLRVLRRRHTSAKSGSQLAV
jgi:hypothetical protein